MKKRSVAEVLKGAPFHWVGDGFRVSNYFPSNDLDERISPFFLMDYHPPHEYAPTTTPRGVGSHPHRGFETVTIAFEGSVAHHDSAGNAGVIGPGDVQWMTAASGVLHKEYHEAEWAKEGGRFHMVQLWVNLPAKHKMDPPGYQAITRDDIAKIALANDGGEVRVIAGSYKGKKGPARTFTPINLWEIRLNAGGKVDMAFPAEENASFLVLDGDVRVHDETAAKTGEFVLFENAGEDILVQAGAKGARLLLLNGLPLGEPAVSYGPFVMNTEEEIHAAVRDFRSGKFGHLE